MSLSQAVSNFFQLLQLVIIIRLLLTWFPNVNWYNQPFRFLRDVTDPLLEPFRRMIPPLGGIDFSPIVLFIVLNMVESVVLRFVGG